MLNHYSLPTMDIHSLMWIFTHLTIENQNYIYNHIDKVMERLRKENTILRFPGNQDGVIFSPCSILYRMVKKYQPDTKAYFYYMKTNQSEVFIGSDYLWMEDAFSEVQGPLNQKMIRSIAQLKFKDLTSILDLISAAGAIVGVHTDGAFGIAFKGIKESLAMLKAFTGLKYASYEGLTPEWNDLEEAIQYLSETELYFGNDPEEDKAHVTACIYYICSIYNFATYFNGNWSSDEIYDQFLMRHLRCLYDDEAYIKTVFAKGCSWFSGKNLVGVLQDNENHMISTSKSIVAVATKPAAQKVCMHDPFSMSEREELKSIKEILVQFDNQEESLIIDSICRKTKVRRETIRVTTAIEEDLLTMYLAEFNRENPLILPKDIDTPAYVITYEGHLYVLFQIMIGGRVIKDNLYAIRKSGADREEREYTLLQFRKDPNHSYIFYY